MFRNYLKIALRNLTRKKLYGAVNIIGLALGLATSFAIGTWVYQELSYDRHFDQADQIYRVGVNFYNIGDMAIGPVIFDSVVEEFPEVAASTSLDELPVQTITVDDKTFEESGAFAADKDFFQVFSFPFVKGNPETALDEPNQVVLSESVARKIFGDNDAMGQTLLIGEEKEPYSVVGIVRETEKKSHMNITMWLPLERDPDATRWTSAYVFNYVLLKPGFTKDDLTSRLNQVIKDRIYPSLNRNEPYEEWIQTSAAYTFIINPLTDLYLKTNLRFDFFTPGNATNVYASAAIALFIILLAGINFVNISTARSSSRAKEVGIRKTLGSKRTSLIRQFLTESVLISLISCILAFALGEIFIKLFEEVTTIHLLDSLFINFEQILIFLGVSLLIGLLAGIYPAFYLSAFKPVSILKNNFAGVRKSWFRNGLVITQFTVSTCLIVATAVVFQQIQFLQQQDLGFEKENVLVIDNVHHLNTQQETFREQTLNLSGVKIASFSRRIPLGQGIWVKTLKTPDMEESKSIQTFLGDENYLSAMGFQLLEGRNFSKDIAGDTSAIILSRSAVKELELEDPVGAKLKSDDFEVIGVVDDFNYQSLHNDVEPTAITYSPWGGDLVLKINNSEINGILAELRDLWESHDIAEPMNYYFLDDKFRQTLDNDRALGKAVSLFSVFAIIISCLGLFGLASYICEQRTKEIGIRKVLGAAVSNLIVHLNKDFTRLVMISIGIAVPLSYIIMNEWLSNFAYKTDIGPSVFIIAGISALLIAWITVSGQSIKTALMNPVDSLKNE